MKLCLLIVMLMTSITIFSMENEDNSTTPRSAKEQSPSNAQRNQSNRPFPPIGSENWERTQRETQRARLKILGGNIGKGIGIGMLTAAGGTSITQILLWASNFIHPHNKTLKAHPAIWAVTFGGVFLCATGLIKKLYPTLPNPPSEARKQDIVYFTTFGAGALAATLLINKYGLNR